MISSELTPASSSVAWTPNRELDAVSWAIAGRRIGAVGRCIQWLLGDWIAYGNERFGERYARAAKITGYDTQTLMNMVYVASRFAISRRRENLSWSHHETLAALSFEAQECWLDQATANRWSVADLRTMLRTAKREAEAKGLLTRAEDESQAPVSGVTKCPRCGEDVLF